MQKIPLVSAKLALAIGAALLVSACSSNSSTIEEKLQRAEQAALRAEAAQAKAELAAQKSATFGAHSNTAVVQEPEAEAPGFREDAKSQPEAVSAGSDPKPDNPNS